MTVCLLQASNAATPEVSGSSINKEYAEEQTRRQHGNLVDENRPPTLVQEVMMNGIFIIIIVMIITVILLLNMNA